MQRDDPRHALRALAAARGDSLTALSAMLGRNVAYLQQYVTRGTPRLLAERDRKRLADYLGVGEDVLGGRSPDMPRIRRLDIAASAGPGTLVDTEIAIGTDVIDPALARRLNLTVDAASMIRVRGDSMEPLLVDGDTIVIDERDRQIPPGGAIFVLRLDDLVMVKRVTPGPDGLVITSDNRHTPALPDGAGRTAEIVGRVVWQMRALR